MGSLVIIKSCLVFICILAIANGQEIKLCPNSGPLHLPPPGCALKRNAVEGQNCFTISVVCYDGNQGTWTTAAAPKEQSSAKPDTIPVATAASVDSSIKKIDQSEFFCPIYADPPLECSPGQRNCTKNDDCGVTEVCCPDVACKVDVCKSKLLPCPSGNEQIPAECAIKIVVDREKNCFSTIGDCPQGVTTARAGGNTGVASTPGTTGSNAENSEVAKPANRGSCPARDPDAKPNSSNCDKTAKKCSDDSECGSSELCCADDDCQGTVCKKAAKSDGAKSEANPEPTTSHPKRKLAFAQSAPVATVRSEAVKISPFVLATPTQLSSAVPVTDNPVSANVTAESKGPSDPAASPKPKLSCPPRDVNVTADPSKCNKSLRNCSDDADCGSGDLCCVDDDCQETVCKKGMAGSQESEEKARKGIENSVDASVQHQSAGESNGTSNRTLEMVPAVLPLPIGGEIAPIPVNLPADVVPPVKRTNTTESGGSGSGNAVETSIDANAQQQSASKSTFANETTTSTNTSNQVPTVGPLTSGDEVAPVTVNLPSDAVPPQFPPPDVVVAPLKNRTESESSGNGTGIGTITETSIDGSMMPHNANMSGSSKSHSETSASSDDTSRFCPSPKSTKVGQNQAKCLKFSKTCSDHADCAIFEACCFDNECGHSVCKTSLLPCPPDDDGQDCSSKPEVDPTRNCVRRAC